KSAWPATRRRPRPAPALPARRGDRGPARSLAAPPATLGRRKPPDDGPLLAIGAAEAAVIDADPSTLRIDPQRFGHAIGHRIKPLCGQRLGGERPAPLNLAIAQLATA